MSVGRLSVAQTVRLENHSGCGVIIMGSIFLFLVVRVSDARPPD
jgi:hypothetical protein